MCAEWRAPRRTIGALLVLLSVALLVGCSVFAPSPDADVSEDATRVSRITEPPAEAIPGGPLLRVGLSGTSSPAIVSCRGGFTVAVYSGEVERFESPADTEWRFVAGESGIDGSASPGSFSIQEGTIRATPEGQWPLEVDGTPYRGEIELFLAGAGKLSVVNVVDVESYLRGVVPIEIGSRPIEEIEAVKAQAVAARTYAIASGGSRAGGDFDVFETVMDQVYRGVAVEDEVSDRAIEETAGVVARYEGQPIRAFFHSSCGGRGEARHEVWEIEELPYLTSVWDTPGERSNRAEAYCRAGSHFDWEAEWSGGEIETFVKKHLPEVASTPIGGKIRRVKNLRVTERTSSGRVRWLEVETDVGTYRVFGDRVRWLLRRPGSGGVLWSAWFDLEVKSRGGKVTRAVARGKGYGHGVGLCQHGAMGMAREGHTFDEILMHYYPGAELARAYLVEEE